MVPEKWYLTDRDLRTQTKTEINHPIIVRPKVSVRVSKIRVVLKITNSYRRKKEISIFWKTDLNYKNLQ